jgi:multidrug efflux system membrane fusion protein
MNGLERAMRVLTGWMWGGALCAALLAGGCERKAAVQQQQMPPPLVTVTAAVAGDVPVYLDEIGTGAASDSVTITPQVTGPIIERHFEDGADLKKGQLLFKIDPRPFQAQLDLAQAQLGINNTALDLATIQLKRYDEVTDPRAIAKTDYDTKKNAVELAKAQIKASQAAIETAKLNLQYCDIHATMDGRAGRRLVDVGNIVVANQTGLLTIQRLDPMYVYFTVAERDLPDVQREMAAGTLKTLVRLPVETDAQARSGELTFLDNAVQESTGTISLRATVANKDHRFWPGQFLQVRLVLTTKKNAVLIPNEATQISQQGPFVYVVKPDDTADLRQVTLGQRQGDQIVIASGVTAGEQVVVTGQMMVQPGGKVRIGTAAAASTTNASAPASGSAPAASGPSGPPVPPIKPSASEPADIRNGAQ